MMSFWPSVLILIATAVSTQCYTNPILWEDLADIDILRVDDTYYYSASTMHYSPGAPILKSYDLVNWEYIGHSVPELVFGDKYYLNSSGSAYVNGIWASSLRYRESNGVFYWYGCIESGQTHIFTATDPAGEWTHHPPIDACYYDVGILVDNNDTMYAAYGAYNISIVELSSDGLTPVREEIVWEDSEVYLEGSRFYHMNDYYYVWLTRPSDGQFVLKADNPWGPYTRHEVLSQMSPPVPDSGTPHQGGIVDTLDGDWYYLAFLDAYPGGRIPVLAPLTWDDDGLPHVVTDENGGWGATYPTAVETDKTVTPAGPYTDSFDGATLSHEWEWNHNPDNSAWSIGSDGLVLHTATVTEDLNAARNTLTHRILGPKSSGTFRLNLADMADGDVAGVGVIRDESAYIGVRKEGETLRLVAVHGITLTDNGGWTSTSNGTVVATADGVDLSGVAGGASDLWLRVEADVHATLNLATNDNPARLLYSLDGEAFEQLGDDYALHNRWEFFMAFRFAVFNYATMALGGSVIVKEFDLQLVE